MLDLALPLNVLALASAFDLNVLDLASSLPLNMLDLASPLNMLDLALPWNQILPHLIWSGTMSTLTRLVWCYVDANACPSAVLLCKISWSKSFWCKHQESVYSISNSVKINTRFAVQLRFAVQVHCKSYTHPIPQTYPFPPLPKSLPDCIVLRDPGLQTVRETDGIW